MKKKAFYLLLTLTLCLTWLPIQAHAAETLRLEGNRCIFTFPMGEVGDVISLNNVSSLTSGYFELSGESLWTDCAVVYGQTTITLLKSGMLSATRQNGELLDANNVVNEPSEKNIGATLILTEPGFYNVDYFVGGDYSGFAVEIRPAPPNAATPNAAYATYLQGIIDQYGVLPQFENGNVSYDYAGDEYIHDTGLFYAALVDFDGSGTKELLALYFGPTDGSSLGVVCEVWSSDSSTLKPLYSNKDDHGYPFTMAGAGPIGSISLATVDGKPHLHTTSIGYTGTTKVTVDTLYTLTGNRWKTTRSLEWDIYTPDEEGNAVPEHTYTDTGTEISESAYKAAQAKITAQETTLASTLLSDGAALNIGVPNYNAAVQSFVALLGSEQVATPTASEVLVDSKHVEFEAFNIDGNNYFKLRDIAAALNGTTKQFSVLWDGAKNTISLRPGAPYTLVGGELEKSGAAGGNVTPGDTSLLIDGTPVELTVYTISGNNYFKLRDLGQALQFAVRWDNATSTVQIDTAKPYTSDT